ncbi:L-lactate MFS transporter [Paenibacillus abyssi]|uniref:MFS transporter n=1 Tax=Paenibacillus abyssi TaxID=1340531 RepID=A0A917FMI9_9BACL|nr:OFA family MFS transporter [Paenibacillus abyssi]GGF89461.1 MFS transporter [Paenibacillus abyssi]
MQKTKNRWLIAASAVGIHISIGSVYAWSVFSKPLIDQFGWDLKEVTYTFSIAILFLGLSAAFLGHFVEKFGPRKAGLLSAAFFGIGIIGSGYAVDVGSLALLYLFYGVFGGIGLGVGYITPVSSLVKWFPDRRGLATGLAIMGFGFASLISSPIMARLIDSVGIANTFYILGAIYFVLIASSALYLAPPPAGWLPAHYKAAIESGKKELKVDLSQLTANEAVKTSRFWMLWVMLFINVTCGIAVISVASPMAQEIAGMTPLAAAAMVGVMGLFNGLGRIGWASFSDYIGRPNTYTTFFIIQTVAFVLLPLSGNALIFQLLIFLILTCYGGGFASIPAYIGDLFGTKQLGAIHGYILTAWAAAGLAGPIIAAWVRTTTDSYIATLYIFAVLFVAAFIVSLLIRLEIKRLQAANAQLSKGLAS